MRLKDWLLTSWSTRKRGLNQVESRSPTFMKVFGRTLVSSHLSIAAIALVFIHIILFSEREAIALLSSDL